MRVGVVERGEEGFDEVVVGAASIGHALHSEPDRADGKHAFVRLPILSPAMPSLPHQFRDPALLELALTHASVGSDGNNERLEFLGDAVLDLIIAEELYRRHPKLAEGVLTELKAWVVSRKTLAIAAARLGLEPHVRVGPGLQRVALPRSLMANVYESVLGAVYLDSDFQTSRDFVLRTLHDELESVRERTGVENPKQSLQQLSQRVWGTPPEYIVLDERGRSHARAFLVAAQAGDERFPSAWGRTLKEAERWAAHEALLALEEHEVV